MNGATIAIELELHVDGDSLAGRATDESGATREFSGWLGLVAAIDALVSHASGEAPPPRTSS